MTNIRSVRQFWSYIYRALGGQRYIGIFYQIGISQIIGKIIKNGLSLILHDSTVFLFCDDVLLCGFQLSTPMLIFKSTKCTKPGNNLGQNIPQGTDLRIELPHSLDAQNHDDGANDQNAHVD